MIIVSALGGGGSSYVTRALQRLNFPAAGPAKLQDALLALRSVAERTPQRIPCMLRMLKAVGLYTDRVRVLMRPDAFWTDWPYNPAGTYDPAAPDFADRLAAQRAYIATHRIRRSAGIPVPIDRMPLDGLGALVSGYLSAIEDAEREKGFTAVLVSGHWGEYGVFREIGRAAYYLVRDPWNSVISHSRMSRHGGDYRRRGFTDVNDRGWIDCYLSGPHHYWIRHAETAAAQEGAAVLRYDRLAEDWARAPGLPALRRPFEARYNDVRSVLTEASIAYIRERAEPLCRELGVRTY